MTLWLAVIGALTVAFLTFAFGWYARGRKTEPSGNKEKTLPAGVGDSTIRAYFIPKKWSPGGGGASKKMEALEGKQYRSAQVEMEEGPQVGNHWPLLAGRTRLGREADNHVVLDDERISLYHAQISVRDGVFWLEDLGSTNGTFIGEDKRVMKPYPLEDGDQIRIGGVLMVFRGV